FGGDGAAFIATFLASAIGFSSLLFLIRHPFNPYLVTLVTAFITALCADLGAMWVLTDTPELAIAASVLFLVPGVPLICGLLDLVLGHTLSGLGRLAHGLFQCLCIGLGIILALELAGGSII
ncbi:MAG TPA: threonine/serine exporter family protein, partial [Opitutales bacterium]|nr:threonine/serine exporter family protein [Opitutales bacterium]